MHFHVLCTLKSLLCVSVTLLEGTYTYLCAYFIGQTLKLALVSTDVASLRYGVVAMVTLCIGLHYTETHIHTLETDLIAADVRKGA